MSTQLSIPASKTTIRDVLRTRLGVDVEALADWISKRIPSCTSAILVGSAVAGRDSAIADLDITGLDKTVTPGQDRSFGFEFAGWPVHVVLYHPLHFEITAKNDDLLFLQFREVRKLLEGLPLFDLDGRLSTSIAILQTAKPPLNHLRPLVGSVRQYRASPENRLAFYHAIENLSFAWMHFDLRFRYSKPKWLMDDAQLIGSDALTDLLRSVSSELTESYVVHDLVHRAETLQRQLSQTESGPSHYFRTNLSDATSLLRVGKQLEAVWPLRMAVYMFTAAWCEIHGLPYHDLRSTASVAKVWQGKDPGIYRTYERILLLGDLVSDGLLNAFVAVRSEFLDSWNALARETDAPINSRLSCGS